jgi:hypothetical protein
VVKSIKLVARKLLSVALGAGIALVLVQAKVIAQEVWRMTLSDVSVIRQREASGDRPYFAIIQFRSRFGVRGSTEVNVISYEPHDWVSKPNLRGSLPRGGDHMFAGERATLPFWMREVEWRNLSPLPSPLVGGRVVFDRVPAALNTEIVGVLIVGLDNNNTPPHVIRGTADTIGSILAQALREEVEPNSALVAIGGDFRSNLERKLEDIARSAITIDQAVNLISQLTLGSTFNPDQLTGIQVRILPALDTFPQTAEQRTLQLPTTITGGPVEAASVTQALQPWSETLIFRGSGAEYQVRANLARVACPETEAIRSLTISMLSGDDGLRGNSSLQLELEVAGREPIILPFGGGDGDQKFSAITRSVNLPTPVLRRDLRRVGIRFSSSFSFPDTHDNWTLNAIQVRSGGTTLLSKSGRPLMRFSRDARRFMTDISCSNPRTTPPADASISQLEVTIRTGGDDLRGGNDNAFMFILLNDGRRIEMPFNNGARLSENSLLTRTLTLPPGTGISQIRRFGIRTTLSGGIGGDNWNIDGVTVRAISTTGAQTILEQSGGPLVRLTGSNRERIWDLRF